MKIKKLFSILASLFLTNFSQFDYSKAEECSVCLEEIEPNSKELPGCALPCCHRFHRKCLGNWFTTPKEYEFDGNEYARGYNSTCPYCRSEVSDEVVKLILKQENLKRKIAPLKARIFGKFADLNHWWIYNSGKTKTIGGIIVASSVAVPIYIYTNSPLNTIE